VSQHGSHAKLLRTAADGQRQTLHIPMHKELDTGTTRAILRQASRYVDAAALRQALRSE